MIRFSSLSVNSSNVTQPKINNSFYVMDFSKKYKDISKKREILLNEQIQKDNATKKDIFPNLESTPKPHWGVAIWTLFHTISEKISDENFGIIKNEFILLVKQICGNLPCPMCSTHATEYISRSNIDNIKTVSELRMMFYNFHNTVNQRKHKPVFSIDELSSKYKNLDIIKVIRDFMVVFQDKHFSIHMIANDFHRNRLVGKMKSWFNENIQYLY